MDLESTIMDSPQYHVTHLAFARLEIVQAAANGRSILDLLKTYTADVVLAERAGAFGESHGS